MTQILALEIRASSVVGVRSRSQGFPRPPISTWRPAWVTSPKALAARVVLGVNIAMLLVGGTTLTLIAHASSLSARSRGVRRKPAREPTSAGLLGRS
jgi:hypothetical protein